MVVWNYDFSFSNSWQQLQYWEKNNSSLCWLVCVYKKETSVFYYYLAWQHLRHVFLCLFTCFPILWRLRILIWSIVLITAAMFCSHCAFIISSMYIFFDSLGKTVSNNLSPLKWLLVKCFSSSSSLWSLYYILIHLHLILLCPQLLEPVYDNPSAA